MPSVARGLLLSVILVVAALPGCGPAMPRGFDSPEPAVRIDAIVQAAAKDDRNATPDLIRMLDSDDPATRMLAIRTLERITGQTNGYDYAAPEADRREAVRRWQEWDTGLSRPAASGHDQRGGQSGAPPQQP